MRMKFAMAVCATTIIAGSALAQSTDPKTGVGPNTPTAAQCSAGHQSDTKLSKTEFDAACTKMRETKEKTQ